MRVSDLNHLNTFLDSDTERSILGLLYGRRRIGKSTALIEQVKRRGGFYYEAIRVESAVQLSRLGLAIGEHVGVGRLALANWDDAVDALLRVANGHAVPIVLDEFGHIAESDGSVGSVLASALGPSARWETRDRARFVLCGSAFTVMSSLTAGSAPLRGRAAMELVATPEDFRGATRWLSHTNDRGLCVDLFATIGGVVGYATDMVDNDLPTSSTDFARWVSQRVLSNAATLRFEAMTLLADDPQLSLRGSLEMRSIINVIANGSVTAGTIGRDLRKQVSNISASLNRLVDSGYVIRYEDPIRRQRPVYSLADPILQFHFAVLEPYSQLLTDVTPSAAWGSRLEHAFRSRVRGPVFEEMARSWVRRFAGPETLPVRDYVGPSFVSVDGVDHQLDVVVAGPGETPSARTVVALGEAKSGEVLDVSHLRKLERARYALGQGATDAKLLLFGPTAHAQLRAEAAARRDVEIVDFDRLYTGE